MKKFSVFVLLVVATILCSCHDRLLGDWDPIELSQSEISFGSEGGSCTVESKNYGTWWVHCIHDTVTDKYYYSDDSGTYPSVTTDGISAKIGPEDNMVVITVAPSQEKHAWVIDMVAGDASGSIKVKQN